MKIQRGNTGGTPIKQQSTVKAVTSGRDEAVEYIKSAIHTLGTNSKDDVIAKEAIANLSVVLLDLKE